ncbi:MAG TPA: hypothetical protein VHI93_01735 [Candidatus Thermoplasmatota archaeon]|nr:hypothetical protein [Candidatus Thermoplasmatota archaeon]
MLVVEMTSDVGSDIEVSLTFEPAQEETQVHTFTMKPRDFKTFTLDVSKRGNYTVRIDGRSEIQTPTTPQRFGAGANYTFDPAPCLHGSTFWIRSLFTDERFPDVPGAPSLMNGLRHSGHYTECQT